jgi:hypothetical protein
VILALEFDCALVVDSKEVEGSVDGAILTGRHIRFNVRRHKCKRVVSTVPARLENVSNSPLGLHLDFKFGDCSEREPVRCSSLASYKVTRTLTIYGHESGEESLSETLHSPSDEHRDAHAPSPFVAADPV